MPKISSEKIKKVKEMILSVLYENSPKAMFTSYIAKEIARDEEFIKKIMTELEKENLVVLINNNTRGGNYLRRQTWRLKSNVYETYTKLAEKSSS